eukprot:scaffold3532_cov78-Cylindrotheca_fusiformis.AAC.3
MIDRLIVVAMHVPLISQQCSALRNLKRKFESTMAKRRSQQQCDVSRLLRMLQRFQRTHSKDIRRSYPFLFGPSNREMGISWLLEVEFHSLSIP